MKSAAMSKVPDTSSGRQRVLDAAGLEGDRGSVRINVVTVGRARDHVSPHRRGGHADRAREIAGELFTLCAGIGRDLLVADLGREKSAVPPGAQREIVVSVAEGRLAVALVANGWGDDLWPVRGVRLDAELVDEPARAHD